LENRPFLERLSIFSLETHLSTFNFNRHLSQIYSSPSSKSNPSRCSLSFGGMKPFHGCTTVVWYPPLRRRDFSFII